MTRTTVLKRLRFMKPPRMDEHWAETRKYVATGEIVKRHFDGAVRNCKPSPVAGLSIHVRRRLDAFIAKIDFCLPAMMCHVYIHGEQHFAPWQAAIGRVMRLAELIVGQSRNHRRT